MGEGGRDGGKEGEKKEGKREGWEGRSKEMMGGRGVERKE